MNVLKIEDITKELLISRNTVVNLIKRGELQAIKVGGQYRIPEDSYRTYISLVTTPAKKPDLIDSKDLAVK